MADMYHAYLDTQMGAFSIWGDGEAVTGASFVRERTSDSPDLPGHMRECLHQLEGYFAGRRTRFDVPLRPEGTDFQRAVWEELRRIPHGETRSYGQVAKGIGRPGAARAVGGACRSNPIGVIIPCHRVIGSDGHLVGFGGQTEDLGLKRSLIDHEARASTTTLDGFEG